MFTENISLVEQINRILQKQENQEAEIISLKTQIETLTKELTLCKSKENERDILFSQRNEKNTKAETDDDDDDESIEVEHIIIQRKSYYIDRKTNYVYDTNDSELIGEYDEELHEIYPIEN